MDEYYKLPRLYVDAPLDKDARVALSADQAHYLRNVLRREAGAQIRLFNGKDGEWRGALETPGKRDAAVLLTDQLRQQPAQTRAIHLLFAPIKKTPMEFLVEKAVELGATDLHPVITARTENRNLNESRLRAQIFEAAEQCERLMIPALHTPAPLFDALKKWDEVRPLLACLERAENAPYISEIMPAGPLGILIGPEGGFTPEERERLLALSFVKPVSLGESVLRAETAALKALSLIRP